MTPSFRPSDMFPFFLFLFSTECKCERETAPWEEDDPPLFLPVVVLGRFIGGGVVIDDGANNAASALTMPSALLRGDRRDDCDRDDARGSSPRVPASFFFFQKNLAGRLSCRTSKILVVIWQDRASKISLRRFPISPPLNANPIHRQNRRDHGRIFNPLRDGSANYRDVRTSQIPWVMF